ncbi:hypothetical protein SAMD00023353_11500180 [Rosellinia necatrix]|uniref:Uncharacterized protein n=1 Tax=Rosellinia necatrix TaxID=77044 RepID=A0A1W2TAM0_ROSNE|nr:hypothetical protein SAMD00023353_11500180 [Rosellinia necatrix]
MPRYLYNGESNRLAPQSGQYKSRFYQTQKTLSWLTATYKPNTLLRSQPTLTFHDETPDPHLFLYEISRFDAAYARDKVYGAYGIPARIGRLRLPAPDALKGLPPWVPRIGPARGRPPPATSLPTLAGDAFVSAADHDAARGGRGWCC